MKRNMAMAALLAVSALAFAQPMMRSGGEAPWQRRIPAGPYISAELTAIETELAAKNFGDLSLAELAPYWSRMETAVEKDLYLRKTALLSLHLPGAGQFKNGDNLEGAGFLSLHLGLVAGTLTGAYFLLPADLRFDRTDYLQDSIASIDSTWRSHSISEYLPSMGVLAAGMLVDAGLRIWSAHAAYDAAKTAIDAGKAKLVPLALPGFLGLGMQF